VEDDLTDDEGYGYEIPQLDLGPERPTSESEEVEQEQGEETYMEQSGDSQRLSKSYSSEESGSAEPVPYELLSTDPEKLMAPQIYLSKLILDGVRLRDAGHYACVAISYRGHKIREAFLEVLPVQDDPDQEKEYWSDYDSGDEGVPTSDPREFLLLFLMPLGLALLPLTVWFSYVLYKRCSEGQGDCQRIDSDEDLDTERCVLGGN